MQLAWRSGEPSSPVEVVTRLPILVVDDSLTTRMLEQSILESAGYEVDLRCFRRRGARGRSPVAGMESFWSTSRCRVWMDMRL